MEETQNVIITITTKSDESVFIKREIINDELRIKFIKNFEDIVDISAIEHEKIVILDKETTLKLTFHGDRGDF